MKLSCPQILLVVIAIAALSGCSSGSDTKINTHPAYLNNTLKYQCDDGQTFYIRYDNGRQTAWIVYPNRELALRKQSSPDKTILYTNNIATLELSEREATLRDSHDYAYKGCHEVSH